jgi:hypothetical protein
VNPQSLTTKDFRPVLDVSEIGSYYVFKCLMNLFWDATINANEENVDVLNLLYTSWTIANVHYIMKLHYTSYSADLI